jgi:D-beta-D-heptose 7-phosphate kinase/D-beta-D-heptose 1-phosphate adenosyltransferase
MSIKIPEFKNAKVLVVGDVMLDSYWHGDVVRISPEAPVPVVNIRQIEERVGGAGNVALNICSLGGRACLLSLVGADENAKLLENLLEQAQVESCLFRVSGSPTISKTRIIGRNQQLIRLDQEESFKEWNEEDFFTAYATKLASSNVVIFSDYGKGTLRQIVKLLDLARKMRKIILVDPKSKDFSIYRGATVITPNLSEFEAVVGHCDSNAEIETKALQLLQQHEFQAILVTRGAHGMSLISTGKPALHLPTKAREVYDVTGAGDSVIATLGAAIATGENLQNAITLANAAAGVAVKKLGAVAVSIFELRRAIQHKQDDLRARILDEEQLLQQIVDARAHGEKVVMTNGCFDILHPGHVIYLERAKALGQRLIIAVNDDASVRRLKGLKRPINKTGERMLVLAALDSVDWVVSFSEDTPKRLIQLIAPDILVKGGDYQPHEIAGADYVLSYGGKVIIIPFEESFSTSSMLAKIEKSNGEI